jgi:hypothetical protein
LLFRFPYGAVNKKRQETVGLMGFFCSLAKKHAITQPRECRIFGANAIVGLF